MSLLTTLSTVLWVLISPQTWTVLFVLSNVASAIKMVLDPEAAARVFGYVSKPVPRVLIEGCGYIALSSSLTISLLVLELAMVERSADSDDTTTPTTMKVVR